MNAMARPDNTEMMRAFMGADSRYDGIFFSGVRTTGIFCRPGCTARKPKPENIEFFVNAQDALLAGYRPCMRCTPLAVPGQLPTEIESLVEAVDADPLRRWRDQDLKQMGLKPATVRRWFQRAHGMTFHAYARARRLGEALDEIRKGSDVTPVAFDHGFDSLSGFSDAVQRLTGRSPGRHRDRGQVVMTRLLTPLGPMLAGSIEDRICLLEFADRRMIERQLKTLERRFSAVLVPGSRPVLLALKQQLDAYFAGRLSSFSLPLDTPGTEFQQRVWSALIEIPRGQTVSYQSLAEKIGQPSAVRAVARANGDNRIAILIPCHRVIGKDGKLTGYAGGLWRKQRLLEIEGAWT